MARRTRWSRLAPFSAGCYLGDSDLTVRPDRFMSDAAWDRFRAVRDARDPGRVFVGYDCADESALNVTAGHPATTQRSSTLAACYRQ